MVTSSQFWRIVRSVTLMVAMVVSVLGASTSVKIDDTRVAAVAVPLSNSALNQPDARVALSSQHATSVTVLNVRHLGHAHTTAVEPPYPPVQLGRPSAPSHLFSQCPAIGRDTGCGILITVNPNETGSIANDPAQHPFDGSDDTLIGIQNNSAATIQNVRLASRAAIFNLDNDGLCSRQYKGTPQGCPFGPTGYEGPGTRLTAIDYYHGTVSFTGGLAPGASAYFSLEAAISAAAITLRHVTGSLSVILVGGPLSPPETLGGFNPSEPQAGSCQDSVGCPVNTATGNFWHTFGDLAVPGRGMPLAVSHTYNSLMAATDGPLGFGWTFSASMAFTRDRRGTITVHQENGSRVRFTRSKGGRYVALPRVVATLARNANGTITLTRGARERFIFSARGQLLKEQDLNGYATIFAYNGLHQLVTMIDPAKRRLILRYTGPHLTSVIDPIGRRVRFGYDRRGNLTAVTNVNGGTTHFTYDAHHLLLTMTDPRGGVLTNHYDAKHRVDRQTNQLGRRTTFTYTGRPGSAAGGTTTITDPRGNVTIERYVEGVRVAVIGGAGTRHAATWRYTYDPATLGIISVIDPNGHITRMTYDRHGNPLTVIDALHRRTVYTWDTLNDLTSITDPTNVKTTWIYDTKGNLRRIARPLFGRGRRAAQVTSYHYGDRAHPGDVTAVTTPDNQTWRYNYDSVGDVTGVTDPLSNRTTSTFNRIGWMISETSPAGHKRGATPARYTTHVAHDSFGDITVVADPLGHRIIRRYDPNGNLVRLTDPNNHITQYTYDAANELRAIRRPDGTTVRNDYDPDGAVSHQVDALNHTTTYSYDPLGRLDAVIDPLRRTTRYAYDSAGNLTAIIAPSSARRTTTLRYDAANKVISITYSDGKTPNVSHIAYDADGRRRHMTDGTGTSSWVYDSLNRLTRYTDGAGRTVSYGYTLSGQLTSITYPGRCAGLRTNRGPCTVTRRYDRAGRLIHVTDWLRHTTTFGYDADSNLTSETFPQATANTDTFHYDRADRLMRIIDTRARRVIASFIYGRDSAGRLTALTSTGVRARAEKYSYTSLDQLRSVNRPLYGYDAAGNITQFPAGGHLSYDAANELRQLTHGPRTTRFGYDQHGNRTSVTPSSGRRVTYTYDQANRLVAYGPTVRYIYNADGLRVAKITVGPKVGHIRCAPTKHYVGPGQRCPNPRHYIGLGQHATTVSQGTEPFVWDVAESLPLLLEDGTTSYISGPYGLPLEQITASGRVLYYHHDQLGSTRLLTTSKGTVAATYTYDAYGNPTVKTGGVTTPFGYAGQYTDAESGLQYLRARYYDPSTGQFLSRDPLVALTQSAYGYGGGDPLDTVDQSGLEWWNPTTWGLCFTWQSNCQPLAVDVANSGAFHAVNGAADALTLGLSSKVEGAFGAAPNTCDPGFQGGELAGTVGTFFIPGEGEVSTLEALTSAASRARDVVGVGRGAVYGTRVHSAFEAEVSALGRGDLNTEIAYLNGDLVPRGTPGSVRLDVVEGDLNGPAAIYDLKTGSATLSPGRIAQIQSHLPGESDIPVYEVRPQ